MFEKIKYVLISTSIALITACGGSTVSSDYKPEFDYVFYSDGSCRNSESQVCIDIKKAQYLCEKSSGVTNDLYDNLKNRTLSDKASTLFSDGKVGAFKYEWSNGKCKATVSAEGLYKGSSAKVKLSGYVHTFVISQKKESLVHGAFLDEN